MAMDNLGAWVDMEDGNLGCSSQFPSIFENLHTTHSLTH